jgi:hypothetical protein
LLLLILVALVVVMVLALSKPTGEREETGFKRTRSRLS